MGKVIRDFNVNDHLLVKITEKGHELLKKNHYDLYSTFYDKENIPEYKNYYKTDEYGWTEMQMWVFMREFGEHITMGFASPFETGIRIIFDEEEEKATSN